MSSKILSRYQARASGESPMVSHRRCTLSPLLAVTDMELVINVAGTARKRSKSCTMCSYEADNRYCSVRNTTLKDEHVKSNEGEELSLPAAVTKWCRSISCSLLVVRLPLVCLVNCAMWCFLSILKSEIKRFLFYNLSLSRENEIAAREGRSSNYILRVGQ